jgi:predicted deacylase
MTMEILNKRFATGETGIVHLPVATTMEGGELSIAVHVVVGEQPGPTLALISLLHGDEWQTFEMIREFIQDLDPAKLGGTLLAVPVANPVALANRIRTTRGSPDAPDLNQVFPGGRGWLTQLMARPITEEVLKRTDYLIDLHGRWWGSNVEQLNFYTDHPNEDLNLKCREMAQSSGMQMLHFASIKGSMPSPRNCFGYAVGVLEIPSIMVELGGLGYDQELERGWVERGAQVIRNVMISLDMLPGELQRPMQVFEYPSAAITRMSATHGGYFEPVVDPRPLFQEVTKGELVGRVISPHTFEVLETLESPVDGVVFLLSRSNMIHPGEWGFAVIDIEHPEVHWIDL